MNIFRDHHDQELAAFPIEISMTTVTTFSRHHPQMEGILVSMSHARKTTVMRYALKIQFNNYISHFITPRRKTIHPYMCCHPRRKETSIYASKELKSVVTQVIRQVSPSRNTTRRWTDAIPVSIRSNWKWSRNT